ncbi:class I SAM-dependent methyltransferase [Microcoleus sp. ARI1-B5]|uniref:SAM-dependent methyltransferase n=1 Tax=unclassified Microcoleus TaxID=2642155 RepID=UPI002FD48866
MPDRLEKLIAHYQKALIIKPDNAAVRSQLQKLYQEQSKYEEETSPYTKPHNTSEDVERYYQKWTDRYIEGFGKVFQALLTKNVEDLIHYIAQTIGVRDGMKVLDAGCGVCGPAIILAEKYHIHIEAVTISETQVK